MKLYSGRLSLFTGKVRIALREKSLPFETITVPFHPSTGYAPKPPELLAMNPKGQVPVLIDGDLFVYDSTLILEYLEDRYPQPSLYPQDVKERARARQYEAAADELLFPHVSALIDEQVRKPNSADRDQNRIEEQKALVTAQYDRLESEWKGGDYLLSEFGVADIGYFMTVTFATSLGAPLGAGHVQLTSWYRRIAERPSAARELADLMTASRELLA